MKSLALIAVCCVTLMLAACGGDRSSSKSKPDTTSAKSKLAGTKPTKPKVHVPQGPPPKKLIKQDLKEGSGAAAKVGDEVTVQYVGVERKNGKQIDSSWDRSEPFKFQLGSGSVIPGWEQGVGGMKVGGRRQLVIPSNLAYGSGAMVFVIDLLAVDGATDAKQSDSNAANTIAERPKPKVKVPNGPPPKTLVIKDLKGGWGTAAKPGDEIIVNYVGVNYKTGKEFEATWDQGEPSTFQLGVGEVIPGWEEGMVGMKVGGRRELIIPSTLAFERGTVIYVIDLLGVE